MDTYHVAYWSDPSYSSSDEEEKRYIHEVQPKLPFTPNSNQIYFQARDSDRAQCDLILPIDSNWHTVPHGLASLPSDLANVRKVFPPHVCR